MTIGVIVFVVGLIVGLAVAADVGVAMMRRKMVVSERSAHSFEETCARVEAVIGGTEGWGLPRPSFDMSDKLAEKGALPENVRRIRQFSVCSPPIAKRVLGRNPKLSAIMPCAWSVYELADGSVWLSRMNVGLLSRVMGGEVGAAMQGVALAEGTFLAKVLR